MNIKINYGTGVATLPTAALASLDRATKADIKLLFLLCAEPALLFGGDREGSIRRMSERAGLPAAQVEASLAFWRGAGVLDLDEEVSSDLPAPPAAESPREEEIPAGTAAPAPAANSAGGTASVPATAPASNSATAPAADPAPAPAEAREEAESRVKVTRAATKMLDELPNYTAEELNRFLSEQEDTSAYINEAQRIWGGIFSRSDVAIMVSLVDTWGFSWDYILALLASCEKHFREQNNQGKSLRYVYRVAANYHKEGILTPEALREKFLEEEHLKDFETRIRHMFGLGARNLTPKEKKFFSTWLYEYKYDSDIVEMAYNITVDTKGAPNLSYTNGILKRWYEDGLTTKEAIMAKRELDGNMVKSIREGTLTPDRAREAMEAALAADSADGSAPAPNPAKDAGILRRILNLGNRMLTEGETAAFAKWRAEFGFRYEIIYQAYQITLENRQEYSLPYMDAILTKWHAHKLTTLDAIRAYEKGYREDKQKRKAPANAPAREGSFETEDFFAAAVKRSFGEDFDPSVLDEPRG